MFVYLKFLRVFIGAISHFWLSRIGTSLFGGIPRLFGERALLFMMEVKWLGLNPHSASIFMKDSWAQLPSCSLQNGGTSTARGPCVCSCSGSESSKQAVGRLSLRQDFSQALLSLLVLHFPGLAFHASWWFWELANVLIYLCLQTFCLFCNQES